MFRIQIVHPWEIALRKDAVKKQGESKQVALEMERNLITLPILSLCLLGWALQFVLNVVSSIPPF